MRNDLNDQNGFIQIGKMFALEIKGYLGEYKRLLFSLLMAVLMGSILWLAVIAMDERGGLFESFTVGVVDNDMAAELQFVFDFFNEYVIDLAYMDEEEACAMLASGAIPAFIELPEDFATDIMSGVNSPFTVHVNAGFPLQGRMVQLLATGGIAYLSAAQAGIYATLDEAAAQGMTREEINRFVLIPVNVAFAMRLLEFESQFVQQLLPLTGEQPPSVFYARRFVIFWYMLNLLVLVKIMRGYTPGVYARFRLAGVPFWKVLAVRLVGLWVVQALLMLPLLFFWVDLSLLTLPLFLSAFALLATTIFKQDSACGIFIFFTALGMWFASGGIIPWVYLPRALWPIRWLSANYWAAEGQWWMLLGAGLICFLLCCLFYQLYFFQIGGGRRAIFKGSFSHTA